MLISNLFNRIHFIQSVTNDAKNNFQQMLPSVTLPEHVMILNGIDTALYSESKKADLRAQNNFADNLFLFGFLGRFMSQKGFRDIIHSVGILHESGTVEREFKVLAYGNDGFIREDKALVSERGLDNYFTFLPPVSNAAPVIKGLDAVIMPSLWEACGLLAIEALVSGTSLISSDCIGLREVIEGSPAFVCAPSDPQSLADSMRACLINSRSKEFMDFSQQAAARFNSEITSEQVKDLYLRIIAT